MAGANRHGFVQDERPLYAWLQCPLLSDRHYDLRKAAEECLETLAKMGALRLAAANSACAPFLGTHPAHRSTPPNPLTLNSAISLHQLHARTAYAQTPELMLSAREVTSETRMSCRTIRAPS